MTNKSKSVKRPWILIAAYDVSTGRTSEGYVAYNILQRLSAKYRIVLITRQNNRDLLIANSGVQSLCKGMRIIGFDLPRWARWWKRGSRLYFPYAYLWQLSWPIALLSARKFRANLALCHVLNFHNDSIPSLSWLLGVPVVWGPLNHNELAPKWFLKFWPFKVRLKRSLGFLLRRVAWRIDPWLRLTTHKVSRIISAGGWVDHRLGVKGNVKVVRLSQLGVDTASFTPAKISRQYRQLETSHLLVHAGRLDWIKGLDIAIESLEHLPSDFQLLLIGNGPAEGSLRALVKQKGLTDRVFFKPSMHRTELPDIYASAALFLFPSAEAAGLAWVEALSCGLPVVGMAGNSVLSLTSSCFPEIHVTPQCSTREESICAYAELIAKSAILSLDREKLNVKVSQQFGWDALCREIVSIYEEVRR